MTEPVCGPSVDGLAFFNRCGLEAAFWACPEGGGGILEFAPAGAVGKPETPTIPPLSGL